MRAALPISWCSELYLWPVYLAEHRWVVKLNIWQGGIRKVQQALICKIKKVVGLSVPVFPGLTCIVPYVGWWITQLP